MRIGGLRNRFVGRRFEKTSAQGRERRYQPSIIDENLSNVDVVLYWRLVRSMMWVSMASTDQFDDLVRPLRGGLRHCLQTADG